MKLPAVLTDVLKRAVHGLKLRSRIEPIPPPPSLAQRSIPSWGGYALMSRPCLSASTTSAATTSSIGGVNDNGSSTSLNAGGSAPGSVTNSAGLSQGAIIAIAILATLVGLMAVFIMWIMYDRRKLQHLLRPDPYPKTTTPQVSDLQTTTTYTPPQLGPGPEQHLPTYGQAQTSYAPPHPEQSLPTYGQNQELHGHEGPQHPELSAERF
ncbi:hypothetical protein B0H63DRAFT_542195 [Podospora didyma]|uniref:Uncharacterized protein n=1 Tax=Podospora didyma TaxID=330526 RepID=A0AAE0U236_9PEZI|nr:hypothetical protein B0H63DRAFT_542195 [Podospora didyma]